MASEKNRRKIKDWRISSVRNDSSVYHHQSDDTIMSFDRLDSKKAGGTPKFLRTQSSSGILASPRKSRSIARIFDSLKFTRNNSGSSDSIVSATKSSIRDDKNSNYSSLSNVAQLFMMSPSNQSNRNTHIVSLNQSRSMRSVDQIIDENTEFRMSCTNLDAAVHSDGMSASSISNSLEFNMNSSLQSTTTSANRLSRYRMQHFRRRSISWDSSQNAKALMRYEILSYSPLLFIH